jgi:2-haloacid dehalogenase
MVALVEQVRVIAFDIFGTCVDWRTGITAQVAAVAAEQGVQLDAEAFAEAWRERYLPSMARVRTGQRPWAYLDTLHRESLNELLEVFDVADAFDESARQQLVLAWHHLPPWDDVAGGLSRLRKRYTVIALSNGGFALLTRLIKKADLRFDAIISAQIARTYKPDPLVYYTATELLDTPPHQILMVAAHGWDIDGARAAGLWTAFVERPYERAPHHIADRASDIASDLTTTSFSELAERLGCP